MSRIRVIRRSRSENTVIKNENVIKSTNNRFIDTPVINYKQSSVECDNNNQETFWENTIDIVENCDKVSKDQKVVLSQITKRKIELLMKKFKDCEWLAYLIGENDNSVITDIYIPKQSANSSRVFDIDTDIPVGVNIVGVIHSHHNMGASFSHTDDTYINQNYNISILVSHKEIKAQKRVTVPCGALKIVKSDVLFESPKLFNEEDFIKDIDEKINNDNFNRDFVSHKHFNFTS